eukprot:403352249
MLILFISLTVKIQRIICQIIVILIYPIIHEIFQISKGQYTQFRAVGLGFRDDLLDEDQASVKLSLSIISQELDNSAMGLPSTPPQPFDLFIVTNSQDYECYIRAITLIESRNKGSKDKDSEDCEFVKNSELSKFGITEFKESDIEFLMKTQKFKEYFFIIDNTEFPLSRSNNSNQIDNQKIQRQRLGKDINSQFSEVQGDYQQFLLNGDILTSEEQSYPEKIPHQQRLLLNDPHTYQLSQSQIKDIIVNVEFTTYYQLSQQYYTLVFIIASISLSLIILLIVLICKYKKHKKIYAALAEERRKHREQLIREKSEFIKQSFEREKTQEEEKKLSGLKEPKKRTMMFDY